MTGMTKKAHLENLVCAVWQLSSGVIGERDAQCNVQECFENPIHLNMSMRFFKTFCLSWRVGVSNRKTLENSWSCWRGLRLHAAGPAAKHGWGSTLIAAPRERPT